jgi:hypothetical protein
MASTPEPRTTTGLRSGDRVVAIAEVGPSTITIHGHGTYRCRTAGDVPDAVVRRVHAGVEAADGVDHDFGPWLSVVCAPMPAVRAARTADHLRAAEARRRTTHPVDRARRLAGCVHREREVVLERGGVIAADTCVLVMRADAFIDYASGVTVTTTAR